MRNVSLGLILRNEDPKLLLGGSDGQEMKIFCEPVVSVSNGTVEVTVGSGCL